MTENRKPSDRTRPLFAGCPTHPEHADRKHDYRGGLSNYGDPCDYQISRAEPAKDIAPLLAGISELADRYNVQPNTVAVWTQRHDDFPKPLIQVGGRVRVWWVPDVDQWVENRS